MLHRLTCASILALLAAVFMPYTAAATEISITSGVAAARVTAMEQLRSLGVNPSDAVFQVGPRNYVGGDCPGSGWNCTASAVVVQIGTGRSPAVNSVSCTPSPGGSTGPGTCTVIQVNTTGGTNEARCTEFSNENPTGGANQSCTIDQTNTSGTNRSFVDQRIFQSATVATQEANQTANVNQKNVTGQNQSAVVQTISQSQSTKFSLLAPAITQSQEAHQDASVCQGAAPSPCANIASASTANPRNISGVAQTNLQSATVRFAAGAVGNITQLQNAAPSGGPKSVAVVRQNSKDKINDAGLLHFNRVTALVLKHEDDDDDDNGNETNGFSGSVTQKQGNGSLCNNSGLCGFEFQDSTGVQRAFERQDEVQRMRAPENNPSTLVVTQEQHGPEFCCATQTASLGVVNNGNVNNVSQRKVNIASGTIQTSFAQGHCLSLSEDGNNCTVNQTVTQQDQTQTNSCTGSSCNIATSCTSQTETGATECQEVSEPDIPCPPDECLPPCDPCLFNVSWRHDGPATT